MYRELDRQLEALLGPLHVDPQYGEGPGYAHARISLAQSRGKPAKKSDWSKWRASGTSTARVNENFPWPRYAVISYLPLSEK